MITMPQSPLTPMTDHRSGNQPHSQATTHISQNVKSSWYSTSSDSQPTWSPSFLQTHYHTVQSVPYQFICPTSMETSQHTAHTKNLCPHTSRRLSTNIHHSNSCHGADSRKTFSVSSLHVTTPTMTLSDQFAFRPTGSPTTAIISLLNMLLANPFVIVIAHAGFQ